VDVVTATSAVVFATFEDGTSTWYYLPAYSATITVKGNGASGSWTGIGASFEGAEDLSSYNLTFTDAASGIVGSFDLVSVSLELLKDESGLFEGEADYLV
jgi:hypothetical protein